MSQQGSPENFDHWAIIVNPAAGGGTFTKREPWLRSFLRDQGIRHTFFISSYPGQAVDLAQRAYAEGYRKIASLGGDGTHHEVINGCWKANADLEDLLFSALPAGSGNDWIKFHSPHATLAMAVGALRGGHVKYQGLGIVEYTSIEGRLEQRCFINIAGAAYDAEVVERINRHPGRRKSTLIYLIEGLRGLYTYRPKEITMTSPEHTKKAKVLTLHAGICGTSGGGMRFLPHADPSSGRLACTFLPALPVLRLLAALPLLYNGKIGSLKGSHLWETSNLSVYSDQKLALEADGEFLGYAPFSVRLRPNLLKFVDIPNH